MSDLGRRGMPLRTGVHKELEAVADEILRQHLSGITKHSEKSDVLTPWKEQSRRNREVYVPSGTPDGALRRGIFTRAWNPATPHLNSVEGFAPVRESRAQHKPEVPTHSLWDSE